MELRAMMRFTKRPNEYNALVLAYVGDSLYDVYVRSRIIEEHPGRTAHRLHVEAIRFVSAHGQSEAVKVIEPILSDEELAAYKRGRNAKSYTVPKNADVGDYRRATGFEALLGWLFTGGREQRLKEVMELAYNSVKALPEGGK